MGVHSIKNAEKDSFTGLTGRKAAHGSDASPNFHKESFNDVGGPHLFPEWLWCIKEFQQFYKVIFQAGYRRRSFLDPSLFPSTKLNYSLSSVGCLIDVVCLLHAVLLRRFQAVTQVPELMHPTTLMGCAMPHKSPCLGHAFVAIGDDQFQLLSFESSAI